MTAAWTTEASANGAVVTVSALTEVLDVLVVSVLAAPATAVLSANAVIPVISATVPSAPVWGPTVSTAAVVVPIAVVSVAVFVVVDVDSAVVRLDVKLVVFSPVDVAPTVLELDPVAPSAPLLDDDEPVLWALDSADSEVFLLEVESVAAAVDPSDP
jgi:hypothetical protein